MVDRHWRHIFLPTLFCLVLTSLPPGAHALEMTVAPLNDTRIAWGEMGNPDGPPVVLIMGLGASHRLWGEDFPGRLADAGLRVIMLDNRDVGESERFDSAGNPVIWWNFVKVQLGFDPWTAYTLDDMAADVAALLDHLEIERAHVVGASMGGMIAQLVAINHPERTHSLVSIMSSTGAEHLPPPSSESSGQLSDLASAEGSDRATAHERGVFPEAMPRQIMAILASGDRSPRLAKLDTPTLVIHGLDDQLLMIEHGRHTAEVIPGAQLEEIAEMGHNLPEPVIADIVDLIVQHVTANDGLAAASP